MTTFTDAAYAWLTMKRETVKASTFAIYHYSVTRRLIPDLGEIALSELTESDLNDYLRGKFRVADGSGEGTLSWKTVSDLRSILRMILEYASRNGYPQLRNIQLTLPSTKPHTIQLLTGEEQRKLTEYLLREITPLKLGILFSLYSGLRIGEMCGIRWEDVDFQCGTLHVARTVIRIRDVDEGSGKKTKLMISDPKTVNSFRTIPIPHDILNKMVPYRKDPDCYLLTGTKEFMEPRRLLSRYKSILKEAGLPDYSFHALRHSFASRCIEQEFDIKSLCEIMGHSNVKITMDRYVHPSMEFKKQQMDRLTLPEQTGKREP